MSSQVVKSLQDWRAAERWLEELLETNAPRDEIRLAIAAVQEAREHYRRDFDEAHTRWRSDSEALAEAMHL